MNNQEKVIYKAIQTYPQLTTKAISEMIGMPKDAFNYHATSLRDMGLIEHSEIDKKRVWITKSNTQRTLLTRKWDADLTIGNSNTAQ